MPFLLHALQNIFCKTKYKRKIKITYAKQFAFRTDRERWDITAPKTTMNEIITDFIRIITDFIRMITDFISITTEDILRSISLMDKINGKILIS